MKTTTFEIKKDKTFTRADLDRRFDLNKVFVYCEPNVKAWEKDIYHFCVLSFDQKRVKFLKSLKVYPIDELKAIPLNCKAIECWYDLGRKGISGYTENNDVCESRKSRALYDIITCTDLSAPFSNKTLPALKTLSKNKTASLGDLLSCETEFIDAQFAYNQKQNGQTQLF